MKPATKTKTKAVTTAPAGALVTTPVDMDAWGVAPLSGRDIMIPKILAMQAMSKAVTAGEAKFGELRDSLNGAILGDTKKPIEFIPFYMEKVYVVMREKEGKFTFHRQENITQYTEDHEFDCVDKETKKPEKWYRTMNFYVLLPGQIADGTAIPYLLSFRSTSARAGQKLATTMFLKNLKAGKTPAAMACQLFSTKVQNDKGTFIVLDVKELRPSTETEVAEAFQWVQKIRGGKTRVDHSDLEQDSSSEASPSTAPDSEEY